MYRNSEEIKFPGRIDIGYSHFFARDSIVSLLMRNEYLRLYAFIGKQRAVLKSGTITQLVCLLRIIDAALEIFETSPKSSAAHDSFCIAEWSLGRRMHVLVRIPHGHHVGRPGNERGNLSGVRPVLSPHWVISLLFLAVVANGAAQPGNPEISTVSLTSILYINFKFRDQRSRRGCIKWSSARATSKSHVAASYSAARVSMLSCCSLIVLD